MRISDWSSDVCSSDLAGISAESGLATFRGPGGLWEGRRIEDVCTPEAFARDPDLVQRFYDLRRAALAHTQPNRAHEALARLAPDWTGELLLVPPNCSEDRRVGKTVGSRGRIEWAPY